MRSFFLSLFMVLFTGIASAQNFADMTDTETEAFGAAVRAYLLDNPEVIMEAVAVLEERQQQEAAGSDVDLVAQYYDQIFHDGFSHVSGNPDGTIEIVEFSDYKCGYCKRAYPELLQLVEDNPDIRMVVKEYPILGAESILASRAAIAVQITEGDEAYEVFHDALMRENGPLTELSLPLIAERLGLDSAAMVEVMNTALVTQIIQTNRTLGQQMQVSGTPTYVIGTNMLRGYVPLAGMQQIVDEARAALN
ncbi:MAG: thioredoxin domain-containing protein [Rhodobacteraceae bacterium]|nr:thioredoxin domain-containing protein [Paracoccaceae bacterium]